MAVRLAIACFALLAVAASQRGGCGIAAPAPYDPCAGKACGDSCAECPPDDADCAETAVVKECNADGVCTAAGTFACPPPSDPCAGKKCGDACKLCPPDSTDCAETACLKACDAGGRCVCTGGDEACP